MKERNPIAVTVWFFLTMGILMLSTHPVIHAIGFAFGGVYGLIVLGWHTPMHRGAWLLLFVMTVSNPFFSHKGLSVLFFLNGKAYTLEALWYGLGAALMVVATAYGFACYARLMTSERLLYLLGSFSPQLALSFSMCLRYLPTLQRQFQKIDSTQRTLGLYANKSILGVIIGKCRVFSMLITWGLENGIWTAQSMNARGYGMARRTHYHRFRFGVADGTLLGVSLLLAGFAVVHWETYSFYPSCDPWISGIRTWIFFLSFSALASIPLWLACFARIYREKFTKSLDKT